MDRYGEFVIMLFILAIGTRIIFQIYKAFSEEKYIENRKDMLGPVIAATIVMWATGWQFNVFNYFPLDVPRFTSIVITICVISQASYEAHNVVRWFESKLWRGIASSYSYINSQNHINEFSYFDDKGEE